MKDRKISFTFIATNTQAFLILLTICIVEFLFLLAIVFIFWMISFPKFSLLLGISISIALPILTYYFFGNKSNQNISVVLSRNEMEIQWPAKQIVIPYTDIKSYSALRLYQETGDIERVSIRLKNGKKIRLSAITGLTETEAFREFREEFDNLAQMLNIPNKLTWADKLLKKD
jgi:hypothetical protein